MSRLPSSAQEPADPRPRFEPTTELLLRARDGDGGAWESIDQRYRDALVRVVHGRLRGEARRRLDTEDLIQSTLVAAFRGLEGFEYRGPGSLQAWLQQLVENRLRHQLRLHMADKRDMRLHADAAMLDAHLDLSELEPDEAILAAERWSLLIEVLAELPDQDREFLLANHMQGLSTAEIAAQHGLHPSTVRRRVTLGLISLSKRMDGLDGSAGVRP